MLARHLETPRLGLKIVVVMSLHLNNVIAKKVVAGPECIGRAIDRAAEMLKERGVPPLDIVCGDLNQACHSDLTLNILETSHIIPVAIWQGEVCFVGVRETLAAQLLTKGSCWGERMEGCAP